MKDDNIFEVNPEVRLKKIIIKEKEEDDEE